MGVADQRVLDLDLLGGREGAADGTGIHENLVVYEKGRGPLSLPLTSERAKDFDLHRNRQ